MEIAFAITTALMILALIGALAALGVVVTKKVCEKISDHKWKREIKRMLAK